MRFLKCLFVNEILFSLKNLLEGKFLSHKCVWRRNESVTPTYADNEHECFNEYFYWS